jgi:hypothetical protein
MMRAACLPGMLTVTLLCAPAALAGPPYASDDPEPTAYGHFEIYAFGTGTQTRNGVEGESGIDFNYGATPDLQLTAVLPLAYAAPKIGPSSAGLGNVELAAKYRILHQDGFGLDVAVFPRVFLPSPEVGEGHASLFLPVWVERDWGAWSSFGGGGCSIDRGGESQDFCQLGWALVREVAPGLKIGAEIVHQTPDSRGGRASSGLGAGVSYDLSATFHVLAYAGPGIQNASQTGLLSWYTSLLFTF